MYNIEYVFIGKQYNIIFICLSHDLKPKNYSNNGQLFMFFQGITGITVHQLFYSGYFTLNSYHSNVNLILIKTVFNFSYLQNKFGLSISFEVCELTNIIFTDFQTYVVVLRICQKISTKS